MKERIYTIPVTEAFGQDCECPLCVLEKKMENDALEYHLGPAMMEPDSRVETNRTGFCARHFTKMYNMQQNRLPLGLVIDTHMQEQNKIIEILYHKHENAIKSEAKVFRIFSLGSTKRLLSGSSMNAQKWAHYQVPARFVIGTDEHGQDAPRCNVVTCFFKEPDSGKA
jgi:hypothetical protein